MKWILTQFFLIFKKFGIVLIPLFMIYTFVDQELTGIIQDQLGSTEGTSKTVWLFVVLLMFVHLIVPLFAQTFLFASVLEKPWLQIMKTKWGWSVKESLRAWGSVLLWSLLFIVPGFLRYCQLVYVSVSVMLNKEYDSGHVNAMNDSREIFGKTWFKSVMVLLLFGAIIPIGLLPLEEFSQILKTPIAASLIVLLQLLLFLLSTLVLCLLYQRGKNESIF